MSTDACTRSATQMLLAELLLALYEWPDPQGPPASSTPRDTQPC
nr:hypothetical protein [uncultured Holophaga sp.]